ncbi:MAG: hypothetical protein KY454_09280 [Actinobacteria bacterium]|nr:hypothetical protein [Actinomycetota bacterium]
MDDKAGTAKRRGVRASDLGAQLQKNPIAADQQSLVEELQRSDERRKRETEQMLLADFRAEQERERRRLAAESATVETATRLARMERRTLPWDRWAVVEVVAAVVSAVAAVVATVASVT